MIPHEQDRPIIVDVSSKDVIHNLHVVPMRISLDATPGVVGHMWFQPTKEGEWEIICGQLCGPGHAQMKATLEVISSEEFDSWAAEKSAAAKVASTGSGAGAGSQGSSGDSLAASAQSTVSGSGTQPGG